LIDSGGIAVLTRITSVRERAERALDLRRYSHFSTSREGGPPGEINAETQNLS
jgi:hypothetical protein